MAALFASCVLAACGQKGPLWVPGHAKDTPWPIRSDNPANANSNNAARGGGAVSAPAAASNPATAPAVDANAGAAAAGPPSAGAPAAGPDTPAAAAPPGKDAPATPAPTAP